METTITLLITVEGNRRKGHPDYFDKSFGAWQPGEPAHVDDLQVFLISGDKKIAITEFIEIDDLDSIESEYLAEQGEDE